MKRVFGVSMLCLIILLGTGIYLPYIISSSQLPLFAIVIICIGSFAIITLVMAKLIQHLIIGQRIIDELKKFNDNPEDLFNYSTEIKK